jgi:integrin alpha FG-GAP repeat containing protein 1
VFEHEITNITPGDFNGDGRMDLLIMWQGNSGGGWWGNDGKLSTDMEIVMGHRDGLSKGERWKLPSATLAQPMLFDDDLNLAPALLGFAETMDGPKIKAWRNTGSRLQLFTPMLFPADQVCQVLHPPVGAHSSAFIDMDGDCAPDVVLHCGGAKANHRKLQVWLNRGDQGYILSNTWDLPVGSRSITYADMSECGASRVECVGHRADRRPQWCHGPSVRDLQEGLNLHWAGRGLQDPRLVQHSGGALRHQVVKVLVQWSDHLPGLRGALQRRSIL